MARLFFWSEMITSRVCNFAPWRLCEKFILRKGAKLAKTTKAS